MDRLDLELYADRLARHASRLADELAAARLRLTWAELERERARGARGRALAAAGVARRARAGRCERGGRGAAGAAPRATRGAGGAAGLRRARSEHVLLRCDVEEHALRLVRVGRAGEQRAEQLHRARRDVDGEHRIGARGQRDRVQHARARRRRRGRGRPCRGCRRGSAGGPPRPRGGVPRMPHSNSSTAIDCGRAVRRRGRHVQPVEALAGRPRHSRCRCEGEHQEGEEGRPSSHARATAYAAFISVVPPS